MIFSWNWRFSRVYFVQWSVLQAWMSRHHQAGQPQHRPHRYHHCHYCPRCADAQSSPHHCPPHSILWIDMPTSLIWLEPPASPNPCTYQMLGLHSHTILPHQCPSDTLEQDSTPASPTALCTHSTSCILTEQHFPCSFPCGPTEEHRTAGQRASTHARSWLPSHHLVLPVLSLPLS